MSSPIKNEAVLLGPHTLICIDAILSCIGNPHSCVIKVQYNDDKEQTVQVFNEAAYKAAMKYLMDAINNKRDATDHKWSEWMFGKAEEAAAEEGDDDDDDAEAVVPVDGKAGSSEEKNAPFPEYIRLGQMVAAKMPNGLWEVVKISGMIWNEATPVVVVESPLSGTVRLPYDDPKSFQPIRADRNLDRPVQACRHWLNKPVLFLPSGNTCVLYRGIVRGGAMNGENHALLILPDGKDGCEEVPINQVYSVMW